MHMRSNFVNFMIRVADAIYIRIRGLLYKFTYQRKEGRRLAHVTVYSASNAGDTALSSAVRDLFEYFLGKSSWRLINMLRSVNLRCIKKINGSEAVVIGGHGAFLPDTNSNEISGWVWACSTKQYQMIKKPIIVFAVGYNSFSGQKYSTCFKENIKELVKTSAFFGLRNTGSVRMIQSFLEDSLKPKVNYQPCPTMVARYLYPELPPKKKTGRVAINVALDRKKMRMGENVEFILAGIADAIAGISARGYEIHFITHCRSEEEFRRYLKKRNIKYQFHLAETWGLHRLMAFYNDMDVVIGMRGHGIWIPFGVNCQIISLGNQNKTKWFLEDIHALDWFIDITEEPERLSERIVEKFIEIHEKNCEETDKRLLEAQQKLWNITCENMNKIKDILS